MSTREWYRTGKRSKWSPSPMRQALLRRLVAQNPNETSVFEFGCGQGENLAILKALGYVTYGMDINSDEVVRANSKGMAGVIQGDESSLEIYRKNMFTVSFTIGVMDHIPDESFMQTVSHLERITRDCIYMLETNDKPAPHYYPHNYKDVGYDVVSEFDPITGDRSHYILWEKHLC